MRTNRNRESIVCEHCKKPFEVIPYYASGPQRRRFCSRRCRSRGMRGTVAERFWRNVDRSAGDDECWLWTGTTNSYGYGQLSINNRKRVATHIAWELTNGPVPDGLHMCHHCDNPPCVNPSHLFPGTRSDNMQDMQSKGRITRNPVKGSDQPNSKLVESDIPIIRNRYAAGGVTTYEIAKDYGVDPAIIQGIIRRKRWKHVP